MQAVRLHSSSTSRNRSTHVFIGHVLAMLTGACICLLPQLVHAQGFEKVNTTISNVVALLVLISVGIVTIAIIWAGIKMIFHSARLADIANVLLGATLIGGASAMAAYLIA